MPTMNIHQKIETKRLIGLVEDALDILRREMTHGGVNFYGASRAFIEIGKAFRRINRMK